jgi:hypothetical protein
MDWLMVAQLATTGFTVGGIFILYRDQRIHHHRLHVQNHNTWNAIQATHSHVEGLHEKYAKLYDRVNELEKTHEVHS